MNLQELAQNIVREYLMDIYKEDVYDMDSELWAAVEDDPEFGDLTLQEKAQLNEAVRNVKITVH